MRAATAVRTCSGKNFRLRGRAARPEYRWFFLFAILPTIMAQIVDGFLFDLPNADTPGNRPVMLVTSFALFFPPITAGWRRMRDTGQSGCFVMPPHPIALAGLGAFTVGVLGVGMMENAPAPNDSLRGIAGYVSASGVMIVSLAMLAVFPVKFQVFHPPGHPRNERYGPPPV